MIRRETPYIFLVLLLMLASVLAGLRLGQHVEKTNEKINYLLSITLQPTTSITLSPYNFQLVKQPDCGLQLLLPMSSNSKIITSNAGELEYQENNKIMLHIVCSKSAKLPDLATESSSLIATREAKIGNQKATIIDINKEKDNRSYIFLQSPKNLAILIESSKNLLPLIEKTFEFIH